MSYPPATSACVAAPRLTTSDDTTSTTPGQPVTIRVLGNDTGVDAGSRTAVAKAPGHGTVVVSADGTLIYSPASGFAGADTFTYTVTNANGLVSTSNVTVTVGTAVPPVSGPDTRSSGSDLPTSGDELTQTGSDAPGLVPLGLLFLLAGVVLLRAGRRPSRSARPA